MIVRPATGNDACAIARVQERSWQQAYRHVFPPADLDRGGFIDPELWRQRLEEPPGGWTTLVAELDRGLAGFVCSGPSRDQRATGEVYALYVDPDAWGHGAGRALLAEAERRLAQRYRAATLWVLDDNPRARRFYEIAGWRPDGGRKIEALRFDVPTAEVRYRKELATA
ncbi:MAG TPA: GNAT family N-acetyltransferase [Gaiellaceae bacterium]